MPFERQTLSELKAQVASDLAAGLPGVDPLLRYSNLNIIGQVQAQLTNLNFGYQDYTAKQSVPFTATDEYLEGWAALKNVVREEAASFVGTASMIGTGTVGKPIPAGTPLVRGDQVAYVTTAAAVVAGDGSATVQFAAVVAGAAGTCDVGTLLVLGSSIAGVQSNWTVTASVTPGADAEDDNSLKSRMLQVYRRPPQGGALSDYEMWALQVPGVTRVWVKPYVLGPGTISVYVMFDATEAAHGGIPQGGNGVAAADPRGSVAAGDQLAVANHIFPLQPVGPLVYVVAPVANVQNFTITGLSALSGAQKSAVSAAISAVFATEGDMGGTIYIPDLETAIAAAAGTQAFGITAPAGDIVSAWNAVPVVGSITWL